MQRPTVFHHRAMLSRAPRFDRVAFDVDSTLSAIEGIDELARMRGVGAAVARSTERAMRGEIALEQVYGKRLALVRPGQRELARLGELYVRKLVPGAASTMSALRRAGVDVVIVSGGLRAALLPLMRKLLVPGDHLFAVDVLLDESGRCAGFDQLSPLARADGKRIVMERLRDRRVRTAFVGDGATDLAARPAVDAFIAFTGVVARAPVVAGADHVARGFSELRTLLGLPGASAR